MRNILLLQTFLLSGCCIWSPSMMYEQSSHPNNIEDSEIPTVEEGQCNGYQLVDSVSTVADGDFIAVEGRPQGQLVCTLLGCDSECCMNACGYMDGCVYTITDSNGDGVCLSHPDFICGGSDCSPYCEPFSMHAQHRYRFLGQLVREGHNVTLEVSQYCRIQKPL